MNNGSAPPTSGMVKTKGVAGGKVGVTLKSPTSELVEVGFTSPWVSRRGEANSAAERIEPNACAHHPAHQNEKKGQVLAFGDSKLSQDAFLALQLSNAGRCRFAGVPVWKGARGCHTPMGAGCTLPCP